MKVISISGSRFVLPEGMSTKDIQALAGFLATLVLVHSEYNYVNGENMYYTHGGATVQLEDMELMSKADAVAMEKKTRAEYTAKRDAERASAE
jgi:hypothetical protein